VFRNSLDAINRIYTGTLKITTYICLMGIGVDKIPLDTKLKRYLFQNSDASSEK
jgi:hypothetical protein